MCGIVAIYGQGPVSQALYDALNMLQHRGQDAAGIATLDLRTRHIYQHKGKGLIRDVFAAKDIRNLEGNVGIGHVRYPTTGGGELSESQPFYVNSPYGIALGHNGNLVNSETLTRELFAEDLRHINTGSDSEILLNVLANELLNNPSLSLSPERVFHAVSRLHKRCRGAYAVVALIAGGGLLAFRDPFGIRPLIYGEREGRNGKKEYMIASESVALDALRCRVIRDIAPGEALYVDPSGKVYLRQCSDSPAYKTCIFEYVYLARPDSVIDNVFVHKARMRMGHYLAQSIKRQWPDYRKIDAVMPIPDTSQTAAREIAADLDLVYREGFIKNRYIGRTFIMAGQQLRNKSVRQKLNPLAIEFRKKRVLLVDDSIVRGTTSREIVQMAREAGAREVNFASASPPICHPNVYGIDMPFRDDLIAASKTVDQICDAIGADRLFYQSLSNLIMSVRVGNPELEQFECSVFDGKYAHDLSEGYFKKLQQRRHRQDVQQVTAGEPDLRVAG